MQASLADHRFGVGQNIGALAELTGELAAIPGQKMLVWITQGGAAALERIARLTGGRSIVGDVERSLRQALDDARNA